MEMEVQMDIRKEWKEFFELLHITIGKVGDILL
jgi:hypothetical protein